MFWGSGAGWVTPGQVLTKTAVSVGQRHRRSAASEAEADLHVRRCRRLLGALGADPRLSKLPPILFLRKGSGRGERGMTAGALAASEIQSYGGAVESCAGAA